MLAPLDNETIFKKAFTDKEVFHYFIKDLFNIDIIFDKIETEKKFEPPISPINFELDIYAESADHNFIIEIQKIDYDYNFDRFLHYFLTLIANQQKSAADYKFKQKVFGVVIFARPYRFDAKDGQPIRDNVLIMEFNPKNLKGEFIKLYEHNLVFLNPSEVYHNNETPKKYQDWLDLIYASMKEPTNYTLNLNNKGIAQAVKIIDYDLLDPETLQKMKEAELKKEMEALIRKDSKFEGEQVGLKKGEQLGLQKGKIEGELIGLQKGKIETAKNMKFLGIEIEKISKATGLTNEEIEKL